MLGFLPRKKEPIVRKLNYPGPDEASFSEGYYEGEACPEHTHVIKKTHEERISELEQVVQELRERRS